MLAELVIFTTKCTPRHLSSALRVLADSGCLQGSAALQGKQVTRITFTEVTKKAVLEALAAPRSISMPLVEAYLARRALDYLLGFTVSPVLWTKCANLKSAGVATLAKKAGSKHVQRRSGHCAALHNFIHTLTLEHAALQMICHASDLWGLH